MPRTLYRTLLRELPPRPLLTTRTFLHSLIRSCIAGPPDKAAVAEGERLVEYLRAQREYVTLVERYNPGMNMETKERVRLTARKVGMDLPREFGRESGRE